MAAKRWPDLGKDVGTRASRREGGPHGGARRKALPARRPWEEISGQWQAEARVLARSDRGIHWCRKSDAALENMRAGLSSSTRLSTKARAHWRLRQVDMATHGAQLSAKPFGARREASRGRASRRRVTPKEAADSWWW
ncbi:leucine-rich repeat extensin-like protein 3 [Iris pallida]|uniref:Leucine-rich repeat extensin-like protein 3 n=1 Tax=Iris pallida TaxID=29817 RepID=A0AAX6FKQ3_IRIPA|nr:leucine-rich repeat extensin-like protein 3 [Iris pallida]